MTTPPTITIRHTRADGTLIEDSVKGDGAYELIRPHGFRYFPSLGCLGLRNSRDKAAVRWRIDGAAQALRDAGWTVAVEIDEDDRRSYAEAEADRAMRAEARADWAARRAQTATARSEGGWQRFRQIADGIPAGQPILIGHHSEARARRDIARMDRALGTSAEEADRATYWQGRAQAAAAYERHRTHPGVTLRRIDRLEAQARHLDRLAAQQPGWHADELRRRHAEITEELSYWREIITRAEAEGIKLWSRTDFQKGDFVLYRRIWYEVLRINAKSVSIPHIHNGIDRAVVRRGDGRITGNWLAPYDDVSGRKSAAEMPPAASE
ncbi:DUF3560 domain-containing protein [Streptomyces diastaticus]|uniref:DUF3560 domain-containing protein n=1 Tax=Streptomyces diastaticus TaxID=1956 RepID=UPI003D17BC7A